MIDRTIRPSAAVIPRDVGPVATNSALSPSKAAESTAKPQASKPTLPIPAPDPRIKRQNALHHTSNAEGAPWKAPRGHNPPHEGAHPTRGRPTPERPASPSSTPLHPSVSSRRVSDSRGEGDHLPPPYSAFQPRLPAPQGSQSSPSPIVPPPPQAEGAPTLPLPEAGTTIPAPTQPATTSRTRPLRREAAFYHVSLLARAPYRAPGPGIFQPPPYPPTTAPTTPAAPLSSPKRKRGDTGDATDADEALGKKRTRRSSDDVD